MIDSHCHLAGEEFEADLPEVIARAKQVGVTAAIVILAAQDEAEIGRWERVRALWPEACAAVGVHPHQAGEFASDPAGAARLLELRLDTVPGVRAVGEIGLDYHYDFSPRDVQQAVFRAQLALPATGSCRLSSTPARPKRTRSASSVSPAAIPRGCSTVFPATSRQRRVRWRPAITSRFPESSRFRRLSELREAVRTTPLDRLLIETDSPYLAPVPYRGKRNEPAYVARVGEVVAEARALTRAELSAAVTANTRRLFRSDRTIDGCSMELTRAG